MKGSLVFGGKAIDAELLPEECFSVLSEDRVRILRAVGREAKYPAEIARELDMQVQTVYYHVRLLVRAKLLQLVDYEEKGGAMAKKYSATANAYGIVLNDAWHSFGGSTPGKSNPPAYLQPFIADGLFDGSFVVGSPDPHGRFHGRASEFCAMELAMYFGKHAAFEPPLYYLDVELKEEARRGNLVVLGGPRVNMLIEQLNHDLPVRFDTRSFDLFSESTGKTYGENVGVVEMIRNPFNKSKHVLVLAGKRFSDTRVAVLALLRNREKFEEEFKKNNGKFAKVVEGFDEDGDGIADAVDFLE